MFGRLTATLRTAVLALILIWIGGGLWQVHQFGWGEWLWSFGFHGLPPLIIGWLLGRATRGGHHGNGSEV